MEDSWVSWDKIGEESALVERNGKVCKEYKGPCHPIITSTGGLLFVSPDNKYYYRPSFLHESIRFLLDHDDAHPVMRPVSEGLINDIRGAVEEFKFYAEDNPEEWSGVGVAKEILICLEHLAGKLGTSLKKIEENDPDFDPYEEDETADDPYL